MLAVAAMKHENSHHWLHQKVGGDVFHTLKRSRSSAHRGCALKQRFPMAGFAKKEDLRYFAKAICNIEYVHAPDLAPTQEMLDAYKKRKGAWNLYERDFLELMRARRIERSASSDVVDGSCLLCSEEKPQQCHRRLVAEYLQQAWPGVVIEHIS
jgi:uncharacterized protein YeaO (DUF488 family)